MSCPCTGRASSGRRRCCFISLLDGCTSAGRARAIDQATRPFDYYIETAIRLAPTEPRLLNWLYWAGMAAVHADRSETAIQWFQKWREPDQPYERFVAPWLAVAYADVGREG